MRCAMIPHTHTHTLPFSHVAPSMMPPPPPPRLRTSTSGWRSVCMHQCCCCLWGSARHRGSWWTWALCTSRTPCLCPTTLQDTLASTPMVSNLTHSKYRGECWGTFNAHNSSVEGAMRLKQASLDFSFRLLGVAYFSQNCFWTPKIKPWTIVHGFPPKSENFELGKI